MIKSKAIWVEAGYFVFGRQGAKGLNVEQLSKKINKNKSSFYHYFGDMENFIEVLLAYHLERANVIAAKGAACQNMDPDVINLMVETKDDLLFNKQLRLNHQEPAYKACFDHAFEKISNSYFDQWSAAIGFEDKPLLSKLIYYLVIDNFFLQVNDENLDYNWFHNYLSELLSTIDKILKGAR